jgi:SHS2 domain-containing protein
VSTVRGVARLPARGLPAGVRIVEHTADTGIEAEASTLEQCFARAAAGMFACFTRGGGEDEQTLDVEVRADGLEELLVAWLEELLYQAEVAGLVLHTFEVIEVGRTSLRARVRGRRLRGDDEPAGSVVKAVTRHELAVERVGERWRARVLFDV